MKKLYIKRISTGEIVKEIEVSPGREFHIDKIRMGILRQMNRDEFVLDDSEFDE